VFGRRRRKSLGSDALRDNQRLRIADGRERVPQLVREDRDELVLAPVGLLQPGVGVADASSLRWRSVMSRTSDRTDCILPRSSSSTEL
jgi:hypothetical protein